MTQYKNFAQLKINDFRAIKYADINLNGITVVSGINGCGKSTMSKLINEIYWHLNDFTEASQNYYMDKEVAFYDIAKLIVDYLDIENIEVDSVGLEEIKRIFSLFKKEVNNSNKSTKRITRIIQETINSSSENLGELIDGLMDMVIANLENYDRKCQQRDYEIFAYSFDKEVTDKVEFSEYGEYILKKGIKKVPLPYAVKKSIYIDTPITVGSGSDLEYFLDDKVKISEALQDKVKLIDDFISGESVLDGNSVIDKQKFKTKYFYETHGRRFELKDCATGIKSFSQIQMLLNNGHLTDKTLLIIDEPEAHLHPQWITEYAKLVVMLHKELGVKFFIASHNPDMVSAIKNIAEVDGVLDSVNFYLAEKENPTDLQYVYKDCGTDIDPLFESFNMSYRKLDSYVYAHTDTEVSE